MLEPEHEATRYKIEKGWSDEERESRWQGKTIKELCEHFDRLIRRAENDAERNKMKHRRRYARRKQQQLKGEIKCLSNFNQQSQSPQAR